MEAPLVVHLDLQVYAGGAAQGQPGHVLQHNMATVNAAAEVSAPPPPPHDAIILSNSLAAGA